MVKKDCDLVLRNRELYKSKTDPEQLNNDQKESTSAQKKIMCKNNDGPHYLKPEVNFIY